MKQIPLYKGKEVIGHTTIDDQDFDNLNTHRWYVNPQGYAARSNTVDGVNRKVLMHRQLLGLTRGDGRQSDHIDRNKLNNSRSNLRVVTATANLRNKNGYGEGSIHRGVVLDKARPNSPWKVIQMRDFRAYNLGRFKTEDEAAAVALAWRSLNLPESVERGDYLASMRYDIGLTPPQQLEFLRAHVTPTVFARHVEAAPKAVLETWNAAHVE